MAKEENSFLRPLGVWFAAVGFSYLIALQLVNDGMRESVLLSNGDGLVSRCSVPLTLLGLECVGLRLLRQG